MAPHCLTSRSEWKLIEEIDNQLTRCPTAIHQQAVQQADQQAEHLLKDALVSPAVTLQHDVTEISCRKDVAGGYGNEVKIPSGISSLDQPNATPNAIVNATSTTNTTNETGTISKESTTTATELCSDKA